MSEVINGCGNGEPPKHLPGRRWWRLCEGGAGILLKLPSFRASAPAPGQVDKSSFGTALGEVWVQRDPG